jgi:hypothetical protein
MIVTAYNPRQAPREKTMWHQQPRLLSALQRRHKLLLQTNPHRQMILDLQSWLQHLIDQDHKMIHSMDANESYDPSTASDPHPLLYTPEVPVFDPSHPGQLSTLLSTCNLIDPLAMHHPECLFPASHIRGKDRIDFIFISASLSPALLHSGSLPFYSVFHGDHHPYYIDFDSKLLLSDSTFEIHRPSQRALSLRDPRLIKKYRDSLHDKFAKHNIQVKCDTLQQASTDGTWTHQDEAIYHKLDKTITQAMLSVEKTLWKSYSTKFSWSPKLKEAVQAYRFWRLKLKHSKGQHVSRATLVHHSTAGIILPNLLELSSHSDIISHLQASYQHLKIMQLQHGQLRATFLEELAEAIVINQQPNLTFDSMEPVRREPTLKQLKQLQSRERMQRTYKRYLQT